MTVKYLRTIVVSLICSLVFIGAKEDEAALRVAAELFNTDWSDAIKALVSGAASGAILRLTSVESKLRAWPAGSIFIVRL